MWKWDKVPEKTTDLPTFIRTTNAQLRALSVALVMPLTGTGTPEAVVYAPVGTLYLRTDGGAGTTMYVKETGTSNTGWVGK